MTLIDSTAPASTAADAFTSDTFDFTAESGVPSWKRRLDLACILLASPLVIPVCLAIFILIKIVSRGPILYRQERIGHLGKRFYCFKFRTMHVAADQGVHQDYLRQLMQSDRPMAKLDSSADPRLIPGGIILRTLGLDELPQLLNVLRGEMSLVGPRPCLPYEYDLYARRDRQRCATLPGLTGLWQVNGKNRTTFAQMLAWDICYVKNKSLLLDVKIMALTLPAIMAQVYDTRVGRRAHQLKMQQGIPTSVAAK